MQVQSHWKLSLMNKFHAKMHFNLCVVNWALMQSIQYQLIYLSTHHIIISPLVHLLSSSDMIISQFKAPTPLHPQIGFPQVEVAVCRVVSYKFHWKTWLIWIQIRSDFYAWWFRHLRVSVCRDIEIEGSNIKLKLSRGDEASLNAIIYQHLLFHTWYSARGARRWKCLLKIFCK